ncbi:hypothetical protein I8L43_002841 [Listeria monocytogenes]|nr:hypothetical protein [Listeria monocytogenes]EGP9860085.1 hypothetical protein [Listeria monocytogenes]EGR8595336.1 hypothetical protein [Listeria monocytogenes]EGR8601398.1 hypothetical protein [Listeria monocytogenes]EGR8690383.1 hypothetical protein [Listeria monocytogenes]
MEEQEFMTNSELLNVKEAENALPDLVPFIPTPIADKELASVVLQETFTESLNAKGEVVWKKSGEKQLLTSLDVSSGIEYLNTVYNPEDDTQAGTFTQQTSIERAKTHFTGENVALKMPSLVSESNGRKTVITVKPVPKDYGQAVLNAEIAKLENDQSATVETRTVAERKADTERELIQSVINAELDNKTNPNYDGNILVDNLRNGTFTLEQLEAVNPNYRELL